MRDATLFFQRCHTVLAWCPPAGLCPLFLPSFLTSSGNGFNTPSTSLYGSASSSSTCPLPASRNHSFRHRASLLSGAYREGSSPVSSSDIADRLGRPGSISGNFEGILRDLKEFTRLVIQFFAPFGNNVTQVTR